MPHPLHDSPLHAPRPQAPASPACFADESPTTPRPRVARALSQRPEAKGTADESVPALVPLDVVPVLTVPREDVPWQRLGELATELLLRVDGHAQTMSIVTGATAPPYESARALAALASGGLLRFAEYHP